MSRVFNGLDCASRTARAIALSAILSGCGTTYLPLNVGWRDNSSVSIQQLQSLPPPPQDVLAARAFYAQAFEVCRAAEVAVEHRDDANRSSRTGWTIVGAVVAAVGTGLTAGGEIRDAGAMTSEESTQAGYLTATGTATTLLGAGVVLAEQLQATRQESYHETVDSIRSAMDAAEDSVADESLTAVRIRTIAMHLLRRCTRNPSAATAIGVPTTTPPDNSASPVIQALRRRCAAQRNTSRFCTE